VRGGGPREKGSSQLLPVVPDIVLSMQSFMALALMVLTGQPIPADSAAPPGPGVSEALARERAGTIRELRYDLSFVVPR
jgi:hypothetical protein